MSNPFESPQTDAALGKELGVSPYPACPFCSATNAKPVRYTWWGGVIGPKMLSCVKCQSCRKGYNGKSGKSNFTAIVIYQVVALAIGLFIGFVIVTSR